LPDQRYTSSRIGKWWLTAQLEAQGPLTIIGLSTTPHLKAEPRAVMFGRFRCIRSELQVLEKWQIYLARFAPLINFVAGRAKKIIFSTTSKIKDTISQSLEGKQITF
jgi:hypothetical protein